MELRLLGTCPPYRSGRPPTLTEGLLNLDYRVSFLLLSLFSAFVLWSNMLGFLSLPLKCVFLRQIPLTHWELSPNWALAEALASSSCGVHAEVELSWC